MSARVRPRLRQTPERLTDRLFKRSWTFRLTTPFKTSALTAPRQILSPQFYWDAAQMSATLSLKKNQHGPPMSHPFCQAGRMKSEDAAEPIEWDIAQLKRSIDEWEAIASHILELMDETADCPTSQNWRPHAEQISAVVNRFQELCRRESQQLGFSREDGLASDEAYERVWNEAEGLVKWLHRMLQS